MKKRPNRSLSPVLHENIQPLSDPKARLTRGSWAPVQTPIMLPHPSAGQ